jgi:CubicO group peptidase (beta-lactamase class C family)
VLVDLAGLGPPGRNIVTPEVVVEVMKRRARRRWPRRLAAAIGVLVLGMAAVYGWAWLSVDTSTTARAMIWMDADVGDQHRFPSRVIPAGEDANPLPVGQEVDLTGASPDGGSDFDAFLQRSGTLAFVVVHNDRLVYERYFDSSDPATVQTSFSVAKSVLSTLVGIAIDEGLIGGVDDPVTDYLPELEERDERFGRITLRNLLTMSSGLRYEEHSGPVPWGDDIATYYGADLREVGLNGSEIVGEPGAEWHYNNYNPLLVGMVLERATGMSVSEYMSTRLWQPLGADEDATWSLDSERSGFEKMESGLNAAPIDYARVGLLFLHGGELNGTRIVSEEWVRAATAADSSADPAEHYQYFWWVDLEQPGHFYGLGNFGQYLYVAPDAGVVIVRNGRDWGKDNVMWLNIFRRIADELAAR